MADIPLSSTLPPTFNKRLSLLNMNNNKKLNRTASQFSVTRKMSFATAALATLPRSRNSKDGSLSNSLRRNSSLKSSGLTNTPSMSRDYWKKFLDNPKQLKRLRLIHKIRIAMKLSLFLRMWWHKHLKSVEAMVISDEKLDLVTKLTKQHQVMEESGKIDGLFNASEFKADRQQRVSLEARRILTLLPQYRSEKEIHYVMVALRSHEQIANYPVRMQRLIAQFGFLEMYNPKRAILRQGHPPRGFYYIFYGTVQVTVAEHDGDKVVCLLERGESFGELSIVNDTDRQSSVITKTDVELISISKEAYEEVFMSGGSKRMTDPDHEQFIRGLDYLRGWPIEKLDLNPKLFIFTYFQRGAVITKDSSCNDWLYIIKSGSVNVMKKLLQTKPTVSPRTGRLKYNKKSNQDRFESFILNRYGEFCLSNQIGLNDPVVPHDTRSIPHLPPIRRLSQSAPFLMREEGKSKKKNVEDRPLTVQEKWKKSLGDLMHKPKPKFSLLQLIKQHVKIEKVKVKDESEEETTDVSRMYAGPQEFAEAEKAEKKPSQPSSPVEEGKRTFIDDLDGGFKKKASFLTMTDLHPQFVKVQCLTKGNVFGLSDVILGQQTSLCLISNGAECIMINKEFYRENMPGELQRYLLKTVSPYPDEEDMQADLLKKLNWDATRQATLNKTMVHIDKKKKTDMCVLPHFVAPDRPQSVA